MSRENIKIKENVNREIQRKFREPRKPELFSPFSFSFFLSLSLCLERNAGYQKTISCDALGEEKEEEEEDGEE